MKTRKKRSTPVRIVELAERSNEDWYVEHGHGD